MAFGGGSTKLIDGGSISHSAREAQDELFAKLPRGDREQRRPRSRGRSLMPMIPLPLGSAGKHAPLSPGAAGQVASPGNGRRHGVWRM